MKRRNLLAVPLIISTSLAPTFVSADRPPVNANQDLALTPAQMSRLREKALDGDAAAAFKLSEHYEFAGYNKQADIFWLTIAAENGSPVGAYNLSFELSRSTDAMSRERAAFWLRKARQAGVK